MSNPAFHPGEYVVWHDQPSPDGPTTLKPVRFVRQRGRTEAEVAFGLRSDGSGDPNVWRVPISELQRPTEPPAPTFQPRPASTKPGSITVPDLIPLRSQLRAAIDARAAAQANVDAAALVVQHAEAALSDAQSRLADVLTRLGEQREARIQAMRASAGPAADGHDPDAGVTLRVAAEGDAEIAEAAVERFRAELRQAKDVLAEASGRVTKAALRVVAGIADREGAALADLEAEAARRRAELRAIDGWLQGDNRTAISSGLATLLANPPEPLSEPISHDMRASADRQRTQRWRDLLARLQTDPDADLVA